MNKKISILAVAVSMCMFLGSPVLAEESKEMTVYEDDKSDNFAIRPTYGDLEVQFLDDYRITYILEEREHSSHIDIDISGGNMTGYLEPGNYKVTAIRYIGTNGELKNEPAATLNTFRLYSGEVTEIPLAIGTEEVSKLKEERGIPSVFEEPYVLGAQGAYTVSDIDNTPETQNPQSVFVDDSVFGDDETSRQEYREYMMEKGYMDSYGNYTEKAIKEMDSISQAGSAESQNPAVEETDQTEGQNEGYQDETITSGSNVEVKHFDQEEKNDKSQEVKMTGESSISVAQYILVAIPYILILCAVVLILYLKKKK